MNVKQCILKAVVKSNAKGAKLARANSEANPLLWKALENTTRHRYERATGDKPEADWSAFLDWLMENLPKIIALILALFGA